MRKQLSLSCHVDIRRICVEMIVLKKPFVMTRTSDLLLTALAPMIWGSTYIVITEMMPAGYPITIAMLRALPAGLVLLLIVRRLPTGIWWGRTFLLGALNFSLFWTVLLVAAYRLPGGVVATVATVQPLIVIFLVLLADQVPRLGNVETNLRRDPLDSVVACHQHPAKPTEVTVHRIGLVQGHEQPPRGP